MPSWATAPLENGLLVDALRGVVCTVRAARMTVDFERVIARMSSGVHYAEAGRHLGIGLEHRGDRIVPARNTVGQNGN